MRTDEELYREFLNGDNDSFNELITLNRNNLIRVISRYVNDEYTAEDICQETFAYIFVNKDKYDFNYSFKTYLRMLAKYQSLDYLRNNSNMVSLDEISEFASGESVEDKVFGSFDRKQVDLAVKALKSDYQEVIYLIEYESMTYKKAAKILNKSLTQIKVLIYRARKSLRKIMESSGDDFEER